MRTSEFHKLSKIKKEERLLLLYPLKLQALIRYEYFSSSYGAGSF